MNPNHLPGLLDHQPRSPVGDGKDPLMGFKPLYTDILLETICHLLRDEYNLLLLATLGLLDGNLPVSDITMVKAQDFPYPHSTSGHELQHQTIPGAAGPEDDLIHNLFLYDLTLNWFRDLEDLSQDGSVTRILECRVKGSSDEIEEGPKEGVTELSGGLPGPLAQLGQEGENFFLV